MVSVKEDNVDFAKLEEELHEAVEADARYNRENDAKFRAVNQRVATYDEFRDIVLASHIKPLEKGDRIDQIEKFTQPWNIHGKKIETAEAAVQDTQNTKAGLKLPSNGHELSRAWRKDCKTNKEKYDYLLAIGGDNLAAIFKSEISFGLLGDILCALRQEFQLDNAEDVFNILWNLSEVNRFQLSVQFLSKAEKEDCAILFHKLKEIESVKTDRTGELMVAYGVTL